jgi:hypothetical protein
VIGRNSNKEGKSYQVKVIGMIPQEIVKRISHIHAKALVESIKKK